MLGELLGFMVISGPVFLLVLWLPICVWLAWKFTKRFKTLSGRLPASVAVFVLLMFAPIADEIVGRTYFNHLCATEAGVKIYKTVELPAEYWDEQGQPKFINSEGYLDRDFWLRRIDESGGHVERYSMILGIDKANTTVVEKLSHEVLGEIVTFRHWGGWILRNFTPHNTAESCQFIRETKFSREFYGRLFKPHNSPK